MLRARHAMEECQNNKGGLFLFREDCRDNVVKNNVFTEPRGEGIAFDNDPTGNIMDFNCFAPGTKPGGVKQGNVFGPNNVLADPAFLNPAKGDFRIGPRSLLVDRGDKVFDHYARKAPDVGFFEVGERQPAVPRR